MPKSEKFAFTFTHRIISFSFLELRLAQLALDANNSPAWEVPEQERRPSTKMPLFVKARSVVRSHHHNEVSPQSHWKQEETVACCLRT